MASLRMMTNLLAIMMLMSTPVQGMLRQTLHRSRSSLASYTYADYIHDFARTVTVGSQEYYSRQEVFKTSLAQVLSHNSKANRLWTAGIHGFMDWTQDERKALNGYKPARRSSVAGASSALQIGEAAFGSMSSHANATLQRGVPVRQQGSCGSCWAISAVEAVEAQLRRQGGEGSDSRVSAQALVDCVPNPDHCGGSGGCDGATGELAYAYMRDHGIPLEDELPYNGRTGTCNMAAAPSKKVRVSGWTSLPSNQAAPLMQALNEKGPVVVAVDGNDWFNYESGIFDGCSKDAILGHAVLLKGYGSEDGTNYWLIQNSWGRDWGENGDIRMLRHNDEDSWCGTDDKPSEGVGCDGGPPKVTVCGSCGLLYDPIIPEGVTIEDSHKDISELSADVAIEQPVVERDAFSADADDKSMDAILQKLRGR
mmetsp:Transcript_36446/g.66769  ORF Transcript_36446/g.66769 Transcript_36446/m.66769 type:complete len:424 (-) Transcript_36446:77-1348(-)